MTRRLVLLLMAVLLATSTLAATTYTASTKTVCDDDGLCTKTLYSYPVAYLEGGVYVPVNTTILDEAATVLGVSYASHNDRGLYGAYYKAQSSSVVTEPVRFSLKNYTVTFTPNSLLFLGQTNLHKEQSFVTTSGAVATYPGQFGNGIDLSYTYDNDVLRKQLTINSLQELKNEIKAAPDPDDILQLKFTVKAYDLRNTSDLTAFLDGSTRVDFSQDLNDVSTTNEIRFLDENDNVIYTFPRPYAESANGSKLVLNYTYDVNRFNNLVVKIQVPYSWLANATYPVVIDPTVTLQDLYSENLADADVRSAAPDTNFGDQAELDIGTSASPPFYNKMIFLKFNTTSIPASAVVTDARLALQVFDTSVAIVYKYKVSNTSDFGHYTITWNNKPAADDLLNVTWYDVGYGTPWSYFNVTTGIVPGTSFAALRIEYNDTTPEENRVAFYSMEIADSSKRPLLNVTYSYRLTVGEPANASWDDNQTTLNATSYDGHNNTMWYKMNGGANTTLCTDCDSYETAKFNLSNGTNTIIVYANNSVGDILSSRPVTVYSDQTRPRCSTGPTISPFEPFTGQDLTCTATLSDSNQSSFTAFYKWFVGGTIVTSGQQSCTTASCTISTLAGTYFERADVVSCQVKPSDGFYNGTSLNASKTISDTVPVAGSINNYTMSHTKNLSFNWTCTDIDVTEGNQNLTYTDNTTLFVINSSTGVIFDNPTFSDVGTHSIKVNCTDGNAKAINTFNYTVTNYAPNVTLVTITPAGAEASDDLVCTNTTTDADNETIFGYGVHWYKNDVLMPALNDSALVRSGNLTISDRWVCSVRANDTGLWSDWTNSTAMTIGDVTAPVVDSPSLSATSGSDNAVFNIYVTATDAVDLVSVTVTVCSPLGVCQNFSMNPGTSNGLQTYAYSPTTDGIYQITDFYAADGSGLTDTITSGLTYTESTTPTPSTPPAGGGGSGASVSPEEIYSIIGNATNVTLPAFCGDDICGADESPASCFADCPLNVDNVLTCLFNEETCVYESGWFASAALWALIIIVAYFIYVDAQKPERRRRVV